MSQPIRWSISVDKETDAIADMLQRMFSDFVGENRSGLVKFVFKRFHRMAGNVAAQIEHEQGINQEISSEEITTFNNEIPATSIAGPKPPTRVNQPTTPGYSRGRRVSAIKRSAVSDQGMVRPWGTSFAFYSTPLNGRAA